MLRPRSNSSARTKSSHRLRLAPQWFVAVIVVVVVVILVWLFPHGSEARREALLRRDDPIASDYLRTVLRQHADDNEVRIELVRRTIRLGQPLDALNLLQELQNATPAEEATALQLRVEIQDARWRAGASPEIRQALIKDLQAAESALLSDRLPIDPQWLAGLNERYQPDRVRTLFLLLAQNQPNRKAYWCERAGNSALALSLYLDAAKDYICALDASRAPEHRRRYFLQAVRTLQAGNLLHDALSLAESKGDEFLNERATLIYLIRLARAANHHALAERYARLLLKMAALQSAPHFAQWTMPAIDTVATLQNIADQSLGLAFDDEAYTLAYDVFVGGQKLADALLIAQSAVRQRPNHIEWLKRLARVAEWSGHPDLALSIWRRLAQEFSDEDGWQGMRRLAPSLLEDETLELIWQKEWQHRPLADSEWLQVIDLYERLALPEKGAQLLENAFSRDQHPLLLEKAAWLWQRYGNDERAITLLQKLIGQFGARVAWSMDLAALYNSKGRTQEAYRVLAAARRDAKDNDQKYWRTFADLAWQTGEVTAAKTAYQLRQQQTDWESRDAARLLDLLSEDETTEKLQVAEAAWNKFAEPRYLALALGTLLSARDLPASRTLLNAQTPMQMQIALDDLDFLQQRARYFQKAKQYNAARGDYLRALDISPQPEIQASLIWLLIDQGNVQALLETLPSLEDNPQAPEVADAMAAGWLVLGQAQRALNWMQRTFPDHQQDDLWLLDYADVLEQTGQPDLAWQVRKKVYLALKDLHDPDSLSRRLQLGFLFTSEDKAQAHLREAWLSAIAQQDSETLQKLDTLTLLWLSSQEDDSRARLWRWRHRAALLLVQPELTAAPQAPSESEPILDDQEIVTHPAERSATARLQGASALADHYAWQALAGAPDNLALYQQFQSQLLQEPTRFSIRNEQTRGELRGNQQRAAGLIALDQNLRLDLLADQKNQHWDAQQYSRKEKQLGLSIRQLHPEKGYTEIGILHTRAWQSYTGLNIEDLRSRNRWSIQSFLNWNRPVNDNSFLTLAGKQQQLGTQVSYHLERDLQAKMQLSQARLQDQTGLLLGGRTERELGLQWTITRGHALRLNMDWIGYQHAAAVSAFPYGIPPLPDSFQRQSLSYTLGEAQTRAWHPEAEFTFSQHSRNGRELAWRFGAGGQVWGRDQLSFDISRSQTLSGNHNTVWGLSYGLSY